MPTRHAPFIHTITIGTRAGGVGPFVTTATVGGRLIPISKFPFLTPVIRNCTHYVTMATILVSTGTTLGAGAQAFGTNYATANRVRSSSMPGVTFCAMAVVNCLTRGGVAYTRVYLGPDVPVL